MTDEKKREDEHVVPGPNAPEPIEGGADRLHDDEGHDVLEEELQMDEPEVRVAPDAGAIHWHTQPVDGLGDEGVEAGRSTPA